MEARNELRVTRGATLDAPRPLRHALDAFLRALDLDEERRDDIVIAVGEALANAVEHAYDGSDGGSVELYVHTDESSTLVVDVQDAGRFVDRPDGTPGRGLGLRIVRAVARTVSIDTDGGTRIRMVFDAAYAA